MLHGFTLRETKLNIKTNNDVRVCYLFFKVFAGDTVRELHITESHLRGHPRLVRIKEEVDDQLRPSVRELNYEFVASIAFHSGLCNLSAIVCLVVPCTQAVRAVADLGHVAE